MFTIMEILTKADAQILFVLFTGFSTLLFSIMKTWKVSDLVKYITLMLFCLTTATLGLYVEGSLDNITSIVQTGALLGASSLGLYQVFFRKLGLEQRIFPEANLISCVQENLTRALTNIDKPTLRDILNPDTPTILVVEPIIKNQPESTETACVKDIVDKTAG